MPEKNLTATTADHSARISRNEDDITQLFKIANRPSWLQTMLITGLAMGLSASVTAHLTDTSSDVTKQLLSMHKSIAALSERLTAVPE